MSDADDDDRAEAYPHRQLDTLRKIADAGMDLAVPAALDYCARYEVAAPQWLTERASNLLNGLLHVDDQRVRKRMRKQINEYQRAQRHFARFDAVEAAKEARGQLQRELQKIAGLNGTKAQQSVKNHQSMLDRALPNDESIFSEVSRQLEGGPAAGGEDAIEKSYKKTVNRET